MDRVRIDKWLWAARFFKTRALASRACELGRVECNGLKVKASRDVRVGDKLQVKTEGGDFNIDVLQLTALRGPASVAQTLYHESDESKEARRKAAEERKAMFDFDGVREPKPSKRNRRELDRLRGRL
jgi:ribosome-associated heat shock protein Hsp15